MRPINFANLSFYLFVLFGPVLLVCPTAVFADVVIQHTPALPKDLPAPGGTVSISVSLAGTKDLNQPLKAYIVRDGQVTELVDREATFDQNDQPSYQFSFTAPLAELTYQFVLFQKGGTPKASDRFSIRRPCLPAVSVMEIDPKASEGARLQGLAISSDQLLKYLANQDEALRLLDELKGLLSQKAAIQ